MDLQLARLDTYAEKHCWQYDIRIKNLNDDLNLCGLSEDETKKLKVSDFTFKNVSDKNEQRKLKSFIERHEWLGNLSQYTTHWFGCYYSDILAGVILFNMPNAFQKV